MVRDDDDMDLEEATSNAAMLQHKQQMTFQGQNKRKVGFFCLFDIFMSF